MELVEILHLRSNSLLRYCTFPLRHWKVDAPDRRKVTNPRFQRTLAMVVHEVVLFVYPTRKITFITLNSPQTLRTLEGLMGDVATIHCPPSSLLSLGVVLMRVEALFSAHHIYLFD